MLSCQIIGDSIAVGLSKELPACFGDYTKSGASPEKYVKRFGLGFNYAVTVISLGSNHGILDEMYIRDLREAQIGKVIWLLPPARERDFIKTLAVKHGDQVIDVRSVGATTDHIHPSGKGYRELARQVRVAIGKFEKE